MNEMQKLADELEAYTSRYSNDWAVANPTISWARLSLIVAALRAQAQGEPVAADAGAVATRETIARTIRAAMMPESAKQKHWSLLYKAADAILALLASPTAAGIAAPLDGDLLIQRAIGRQEGYDQCRREVVAALDSGIPRQSVDAAPPAASADAVRERCDWPHGNFSFRDEPGEHDPCYVVMPGGAMLPINHHAGEGVDIARAKFIISACNAALTAPVAGADAGMRAALEFAANDCYLDDVDGYQPTEVAKRARAALAATKQP